MDQLRCEWVKIRILMWLFVVRRETFNWVLINRVPEAWSVPAWPSYRNSQEYLRFGMGKNPDVTVESDFLPERMAFWEEVTRNLVIEHTQPDSMTEAKNQSGVSGCNEYDISLFCTLMTIVVCLL